MKRKKRAKYRGYCRATSCKISTNIHYKVKRTGEDKHNSHQTLKINSCPYG